MRFVINMYISAEPSLKSGMGHLPLAGNSWIRPLAWFFDLCYCSILWPSFIDNNLGLSTILSNRWSYELSSLPRQSRRMGPKASSAHCWGFESGKTAFRALWPDRATSFVSHIGRVTGWLFAHVSL